MNDQSREEEEKNSYYDTQSFIFVAVMCKGYWAIAADEGSFSFALALPHFLSVKEAAL